MRPYTGIKKKTSFFGGINDIILVSDANFWPKMTKNEVSLLSPLQSPFYEILVYLVVSRKSTLGGLFVKKNTY